jgi:hypothetical protein
MVFGSEILTGSAGRERNLPGLLNEQSASRQKKSQVGGKC